MPALTADQRAQRARLAALTRWSRVTDRTAATQAARDALAAKFDPGPSVPDRQRAQMIRAALEAHMLRMRLARARRRQAGGTRNAA